MNICTWTFTVPMDGKDVEFVYEITQVDPNHLGDGRTWVIGTDAYGDIVGISWSEPDQLWLLIDIVRAGLNVTFKFGATTESAAGLYGLSQQSWTPCLLSRACC